LFGKNSKAFISCPKERLLEVSAPMNILHVRFGSAKTGKTAAAFPFNQGLKSLPQQSRFLFDAGEHPGFFKQRAVNGYGCPHHASIAMKNILQLAVPAFAAAFPKPFSMFLRRIGKS